MKTQHCCLGSAFLAALLVLPAATRAEEDATNRISFSLRLGLNISARFTGGPGLPFPINTRTTPDGAGYNYDNGYVLMDFSGNVGGQTWNWGYDDSSQQVVGNTIALSRYSPSPAFRSPSMSDDPNLGFELAYNRPLGRLNHDKWRWGIEAAVNYLNLDLKSSASYMGAVSVLTDNYPFTPGTTPPAATPSNPYQGTFNGPGFVIGDTAVGSSTGVANVATVTGQRKFSSDVWGFRLGPYVEIPLAKQVNLSLSGGLAFAVLDSDASWAETVTLPGIGGASGSGSGSATDIRWGGYVSGNLAWQFSERWNLTGGVQYQNLGTYRHTFGGRGVEVDLSNSIFVTIGVGYSFR